MHFKKKPIIENDLVLIQIEDKPAFYARVEQIMADGKPKWWQVKLLFLTVPVQLTTWILDDEQIRGADFTMGGTPIRIDRVVVPQESASGENAPEEVQPSPESEPQTRTKKTARVLSMHKR